MSILFQNCQKMEDIFRWWFMSRHDETGPRRVQSIYKFYLPLSGRTSFYNIEVFGFWSIFFPKYPKVTNFKIKLVFFYVSGCFDVNEGLWLGLPFLRTTKNRSDGKCVCQREPPSYRLELSSSRRLIDLRFPLIYLSKLFFKAM